MQFIQYKAYENQNLSPAFMYPVLFFYHKLYSARTKLGMTIVLYLIVIHNCKFPAREDISQIFISDLFFICCTNVKQFSSLLIIWQWLCNSSRSRSIFTWCSKIIVSCLLIVNKEKIQFMWYPVAPTAYSVRVYCALWSRLNNYVMTRQ